MTGRDLPSLYVRNGGMDIGLTGHRFRGLTIPTSSPLSSARKRCGKPYKPFPCPSIARVEPSLDSLARPYGLP